MIRVTVWNEFYHEKTEESVRAVYPEGLHTVIAEFLGRQEDITVRTATLDQPECGLPPEVLEGLRREKLTERHGRALLRLESGESQLDVFQQIVKRNLTVSQTEALINRILAEKQKSSRKNKLILKDVRLFLNTLSHGLEIMQRGGIEANMKKEEREDELVLTISIPRHRGI